MAKLSSINKNERRKKLVKKYAGKYAKLKAIATIVARRYRASDRAPEAGGNSAQRNPTRVRNRCATTGRPRGYYRKFGLCRVELRDLANKGLIPGVTKSSW
jgi:small subunit ribosomal protein S14